MATVVVALGGSLLRPEVDERHNWLQGLVKVIVASVESGSKIALVVGGGAPAREGIELAKPFIQDVAHLDRIGICLLHTSPSPRDQRGSRMPSSA